MNTHANKCLTKIDAYTLSGMPAGTNVLHVCQRWCKTMQMVLDCCHTHMHESSHHRLILNPFLSLKQCCFAHSCSFICHVPYFLSWCLSYTLLNKNHWLALSKSRYQADELFSGTDFLFPWGSWVTPVARVGVFHGMDIYSICCSPSTVEDLQKWTKWKMLATIKVLIKLTYSRL